MSNPAQQSPWKVLRTTEVAPLYLKDLREGWSGSFDKLEELVKTA